MESGTRQGYGTAIEQQADFTAEDLLRVAKRHNNRKRKYILVNPLQGKHVPVSPSLALSMMQALGDKVAARHGDARLVIGFAETATAIGAVVANAISEECVYLQTTREELPDLGAHIDFLEEHSHAPEQSLVTEHLEEWLARTDTVVFVDDEISTGKTICNIIARLKEEFPALEGKRLVAASILNRLSPENEQRLEAAGVKSEWLVRLPQTDYTMLVEKFQAEEAAVAPRGKDCAYERHLVKMGHDPRRGTAAGEYFRQWEQSADEILAQLPLDLKADTLVLGTEECMLPGLILGRALEQRGAKVFFHATTRSPISICRAEGYPIRNGWEIGSLYDRSGTRRNFIYNLRSYEQVIILSDTPLPEEERMQGLLGALKENGCGRIFYLGRREDV
ncbi:MAG: phosphoribosyltransferase domain-containing protein [Selenomonadaceae bacterium]|nr:phosphoribosyltransferase domain-containing protein [Selenomonadaceae bacterium]